MSFSIGQMRRSQYSSYSESVGYDLRLYTNQNSIIDFYDQCIYLSGENVVSSVYSYYLKFEVTQRLDEVQDFVIKLQSDSGSTDNVQEVRTLSVKKGTDKTVFELIFNPNATYNQIVFELKRLSSDFHTEEQSGKSGRIMDLKVLAFEKLNNVITNYLAGQYPGLTSLKKLGIQGPPGLMFAMDGEEMKIGKSGVYELYNTDISVSYIGFVLKDSAVTQDGQDFFIMDFKY